MRYCFLYFAINTATVPIRPNRIIPNHSGRLALSPVCGIFVGDGVGDTVADGVGEGVVVPVVVTVAVGVDPGGYSPVTFSETVEN